MIKTGTAALTLALLATLAHADDYLSPTNERVRLSLGFMHLSSTTSIKLDSSQGVPGTSIDAENDFGLDKTDFEPKFEAMVRVGQRHRLRFDYFTLDRSGHITLTGPLVFRDVVLQPGDPVVTDLSMRMLGINYEYSFVHREKFEIAAILRHQRYGHLRPRAGLHAIPARGSEGGQGGPISDFRPRLDLRGEQAVLFRCTRPILQAGRRPPRRLAQPV